MVIILKYLYAVTLEGTLTSPVATESRAGVNGNKLQEADSGPMWGRTFYDLSGLATEQANTWVRGLPATGDLEKSSSKHEVLVNVYS